MSYECESRLELKFRDNELVSSYCTAPFKVVRPFYKDSGLVSLMVLSSSAGVMAGDNQFVDIVVDGLSVVEITAQAYEKIHKMDKGSALRVSTINVADGATLIYKQAPVIPFASSAFKASTEVHLGSDARLIYSEILAAGRVFYGERFEYSFYESRTDVFVGSELVFVDNAYFEPRMMDMNGFGMYEGYTHLLTMVIVNVDISADMVRDVVGDDVGVSETYYGDLCIKAFAFNAQRLEQIVERVIDLTLQQ